MVPSIAGITRDLFHYASQFPLVTLVLVALGAWTLSGIVTANVQVLLQTFILPGIDVRRFGAKKGAWAVVTGASDGIGREYALQLAKAGYNILAVSRNTEKLRKVTAEIESQYKVSTKIHAIDLSRDDTKAYDAFTATIRNLDIGVLVNNAGRSHDIPVYFQDTPVEELESIVNINVKATLRITQIILPGMVARKNGLILNQGSFAGAVPIPMLATYSGSKSFLAHWSQALAEEVAAQGVHVELLNTHYVTSKLSKIKRPSLLVPTEKVYVRAALSHIGLPAGSLGRPYTSTPYWSHSILDWLIQNGTPSFFLWYSHRMNKDIRKRALKKREREAAAAKKE